MKNDRKMDLDTRIIHAGEPRPRIGGAVSLPIFQSSTFEYSGETSYDSLRYIRLSNTPNHTVLHDKLADLEGGESAIVTASGMAAITTTLLALLRSGDHLLAQRGLYGGTHAFICRDLKDFGIEYDLIDQNQPESWERKLRPGTRAVFVESISNPLMEVGDLEGIVEFARSRNLISIIDNTFASPVNFRPLEIGFDVCVHSCTKYLNGHSDIVAGAVIGPQPIVVKVKQRLNRLGATLDPHACYLLHRGLKTLALRVRHQNQIALSLSRFLESHPEIEKVHYPGLQSHPHHQRARRLFSGFGGMLSFEPANGVERANEFLNRLKIPVVAPSLGGVESLITRPATTSHSSMSPSERRDLGISDALIRFSTGIESAEDLMRDFDDALNATR